MTEFFIIRHRNGEFMQERKTGKGYTWEDFNPNIKERKTPRLLHSEESAMRVIRNWLQGEMHMDGNGRVKVNPRPNRKPSDVFIERIII